MARILPFPWSLLAPRNTTGADFNFSIEDCDRLAPLNPETLVFYTRADETPRPDSAPKLISHHESGVRTTENVMVNPLTELGRRPGYLWITPWPYDSSGFWKLRIGAVELELPVSGSVRRANGREVQNKSNEHSVALRETVDQLCGYFAESRSLASDKRKKNAAVDFGLDVVKLAWEAIWTRWAASAAGTEPRTARVVEIARSYLSNSFQASRGGQAKLEVDGFASVTTFQFHRAVQDDLLIGERHEFDLKLAGEV